MLIKLSFVAASVLLSSLAARRFGHAVGGTLGGLPMIAGPIAGFVLLASGVQTTQAIALATLVCLPATAVHLTTFAWSVLRWRWPIALLMANVAFFVLGLSLPLMLLSPLQTVLLALLVLALAQRAMPVVQLRVAAAHIPNVELILRVVTAVLLAWFIIETAGVVPAALSGLLLAVPITGNVLPCFTLPRHGSQATVILLRGFLRGQVGFAAFFATLLWGLEHASPGLAYAAAWLVALAVASGLYVWQARRKAQA
jgi:hypothetical protein